MDYTTLIVFFIALIVIGVITDFIEINIKTVHMEEFLVNLLILGLVFNIISIAVHFSVYF